jgi:hypothetical protein
VRDERDLSAQCARHGLSRVGVVAMPANNHCLTYKNTDETSRKPGTE